MLLLLATGCGDDLPGPPAEQEVVPITAYHGLNGDNAWTWRDDGDTGEPDPDELLKAQLDDGVMDIRRGSRWVDGRKEGILEWSTDGGLYLERWDINGEYGEGPLPFLVDGTSWGSAVAEGDWLCSNEKSTSAETWYAVFPDAVVFTCKGESGLGGTWTFAQGYGLVAVDADSILLDLVAAW